MLLRSITKHVKDQNWFAVFLDFFIVVAGILIAFQITNWNEVRSDNSRIDHRLENVVNDLRADIVEIEGIIRTTERRLSAIYMILDASGNSLPNQYETPQGEIIEMPEVPPFEGKLPSAANTAIMWISTLDGNRGGYETLISSGDLQLIKMDDLASQIQTYYARAEEISDQDKSHMRIRDKIFSSQHRLGSGFGQTSLEELIELVRNDIQFAATLSTLSIYDALQIEMMKGFAAQAEALIASIEETK